MNNEYISVKQLTVKINSSIILDRVDCRIKKGESVVITGANGSGKTTLLKTICGLIEPKQGTISIDGLSYSNPQNTLQLKSLIGYAPDTPPLYPNDTVINYLKFIAGLKQVANPQINKYLEIFNLNEHAKKLIHTLSKGTQQRINLAQALLADPKIVILDEPTNGLDTEQCANFCAHLLKLKQENITLLIASHNFTDILPICDSEIKIP